LEAVHNKIVIKLQRCDDKERETKTIEVKMF